MTTPMTPARSIETMVGMGQIADGEPPQRMKAVVGSCIALALYHSRLRKGLLAHIVLPDSAGRDGVPGKFADTAIPHMLRLLKQCGATPQTLTAKFAGGANMFNSSGPLQIGTANADAVIQALHKAGVPVAAQDTGGNLGRRVVFDCQNGAMTIETAGNPSKTI